MTDESAEYGGLFSLTCILREGNITVAAGSIKAAGSDLQPGFTFAAEISDGDYVGLFLDSGNTSDATGFLPVVIAAAAATPIVGRVIDEPRWSNAPQATQSTWADMLAGGYYRVAEVEFMTVTAAHGALVDGDTTDVTVGAPLKWDLSANAWQDAGTTFTGAFSFHHNATTAVESLVGFGHYTPGSGDDDSIGIDVIA